MPSTIEIHQKTPCNSDDELKPSFVTPEQHGGEGCVKEPTENDVLCGRGGSINSHPGNERFRTLVEKRKRIYLTARFKREKRLIASSIVSEIRDLNPPGRFLSRDPKSGKWKDIGDEKARDKTSQALRENAPSIRAEIETEISEQRAEMQRAEEEEAVARATEAHTHTYYNQGWGYHSYYGYTHPSMTPHPPPPPPHGYPPPPIIPSHGYPPAHYESHWGHAPPPHYSHPPHPPLAPPPPPKSVLEATADSIRSWIPSSTLSFSGTNHASSHTSIDNQDNYSRSTRSSKPIVYVHDSISKKRRMVKFKEESKHNRPRGGSSYRPSYSHATIDNSVVDSMQDLDELEPQNLHEEQNMSLMTQISNHILTSIGSWDASAIVCGHDNSDDRVPFPNSGSGPEDSADYIPEDDMAVEWEGQEVQLVDETPPSPARMPPPERRPQPDQTTSSIGFSSLGSCHSWIPEQFGSAASFFSKSNASMDTDIHSTGLGGAENYSAGGSLGGNSLTRVFENETLDAPYPSPNMSHRSLNQIPSWERSLRSRSPLTLGSDDESLISKTSSKISDSGLSPLNGDVSMVWETRE